jgi:hypothetical protein
LVFAARFRPKAKKLKMNLPLPKALLLREDQLPGELGERLVRMGRLGLGDTLGGIATAYGEWNLVLAERRSAGKFPPYEQVAGRILADLEREDKLRTLDNAFAYSESKRSGRETVYSKELLQEAFAPPESMVDSLLASAEPDSLRDPQPNRPEPFKSPEEARAAERDLIRARLSQAGMSKALSEWVREFIRKDGR